MGETPAIPGTLETAMLTFREPTFDMSGQVSNHIVFVMEARIMAVAIAVVGTKRAVG
jgi:hypothetical protein